MFLHTSMKYFMTFILAGGLEEKNEFHNRELELLQAEVQQEQGKEDGERSLPHGKCQS